MSADEQKRLLDNLQSLLEKQIELARKSNFHGVEMLAEQAGTAIEKITKMEPSGQPDSENRREHLLKLYKKLELMLAAEKTSVKRQQNQVDNARKVLSAYCNIS